MYETIHVVKIGKIENILVVSSKFIKKLLLKTNSNFDFAISFLEINRYELYESIGNLNIYRVNKNIKHSFHSKCLYYMPEDNNSLFIRLKKISDRFPKRILFYLPNICKCIVHNFFINKILDSISDKKLDCNHINKKHQNQYVRLN